MSWDHVQGNVHIERADDTTRTVTTYDEAGQVTGTRPYTADENAAADAAIADAATLTDLEERLSRVEAHLWPPDLPPTDTTTSRTWAELGGVWPHDTILAEGGKLWRNVSGVPLTTPPSGFPGTPGQWARILVEVTKPAPPAPPGPTVAAWSATATYKVDDRCTKGGRLYACKVAHGAEYQGTWAPPNASVWTDVGPA